MNLCYRAARLAFMVIILLAVMIPLLNLFAGSFKSRLDVISIPYKALFSPTTDNYKYLFTQMGFQKNISNSFIVAVATVPLSLLLGSLAAYALARFRIHGARALTFGLLTIRMLPFIVVAIPLYLMMQRLGLLDTKLALILTHTGGSLPLVILLLTEFFKEIPRDIEDSALIDGCSRIGVLTRIVMPLSAPGLAAAGILVTVGIWNDFLIAVVMTITPRSQVATVALTRLITDRIILWGELSAAAVTFVFPMLLLCLAAQRYLLSGLTLGAVKG